MISNQFQTELFCPWNILDDSHKILLGLCQIVIGLFGLILNLWFVISFLKTRYLTSRSYLFPLAIGLSFLGRSILSGFVVSSLSSIHSRWIFGTVFCYFFAFLRQMLNVFYVTTLSAIAVERYLITKRIRRKSGELPFKFYVMGLLVCWIISAAFSIPPLLGIGRYGCDATGTSCELDLRIKDASTAHKVFNACYVIFAEILPFLVMLIYALKTIRSKSREMVSQEIKYTTSALFHMILIIYLLWIPQIVFTMWLTIIYPYFFKRIPVAVAIMAPLANEATSLVPVLSYLAHKIKLRTAMLGLVTAKRKRRSHEKLKKRKNLSKV